MVSYDNKSYKAHLCVLLFIKLCLSGLERDEKTYEVDCSTLDKS